MRNSDGSYCIFNIVHATHIQHNIVELPIFFPDVKAISSILHLYIRGIYICTHIVQVIGQVPLRFQIRISFQSEFAEQQATGFYFSRKFNERLLHIFCRAINIQVVGIHGTDDRDIRTQFQKAPVVFISLCHTNIFIISLRPIIIVVVHRNATEECCATITTVPKDMRHHRARRCFAMRACNTDIKRTIGDRTQHIASFHHRIIIIQVVIQFAVILWHGRCVHYQFRCLVNEPDIIFKVNSNSFADQLLG